MTPLSVNRITSSQSLGWRMAVMPFRNVGAPLGAGIALGMAEEVSASLSRFNVPRMIATATFWDGKGPVADSEWRCRTYQLDYIVEGTIRVAGGQILVNVTLSDVVLDFEVIWAEQFEGQMDDLSSLQQRIAREVVSHVDPGFFRPGTTADSYVKVAAGDAHHALLSAIHGIYRLDRPDFMQAQTFLERAIELDPDYASAHAWMSYWCIMAIGQGWVDNPRDVSTLAGASAERAMQLDPMDARALAIAGHVQAYLLHDVPNALRLHARAVALNPNLPIAWTVSSWSKMYNGEHAAAIRHATMAKSLSPRDPHIFFAEHALMTAHFFNKHLEEADMLAGIVLEQSPRHMSALNVRLGILGHMGRKTEAQQCLAVLREIDPHVSVEKIVARPPLRPKDRAFYIDGLQRAGVPRGLKREVLPPVQPEVQAAQ